MRIDGVPEEWQEAINKLLIPGSVLDLCCGSGRFYPLFQNREYVGVDKDPNFAKTLSARWPDGTWIQADVTAFVPQKQYDNIFAWVSLQHIKPEHIEGVAAMMKSHSCNILMCERMTGGDPGDSGYLWKHDYAKLFPGMKPVKQIVTDVWLMHWAKPERTIEDIRRMAAILKEHARQPDEDGYITISLLKKLKTGVTQAKSGTYMLNGKFIKNSEAFI